jgi:rhamnogalacturonan endolyase
VHADEHGNFEIPAVRPGKYTLYAFANGVMDEYRKDDLAVTAGSKLDVGTLTWKPLRYGKQVWQIGTPDRTAAEFRHGDDYRLWGLWQDYPQDFPNGVNFFIGKSHERTDWNYAQVNVLKDGKWEGTTWDVRFDLSAAPKGTAILRIALAATHNAYLQITVNGKEVDAYRTPSDNAMIRAGIHGQYSEQDTFFDAGLLHAGENVISLGQKEGKNAQRCVMYDALRLEIDPDLQFSKELATMHPHRFPQTGRGGDGDGQE